MSRPGHAYSDPVAQPAPPVPAAADEGGISPRFPLALAGVAIFASIRLLALGVSAFLLPRGKFHTLHYSLWHLIASISVKLVFTSDEAWPGHPQHSVYFQTPLKLGKFLFQKNFLFCKNLDKNPLPFQFRKNCHFLWQRSQSIRIIPRLIQKCNFIPFFYSEFLDESFL